MKYPTTEDGRYFVHRERLWRCTNPNLSEEDRVRLVRELMQARRAVKSAKAGGNKGELRKARARVNEVKIALGERGPCWWNDDSDYNRCLVKNTPYARWWRDRESSAS
ncbi:hypothetical protein N9N28_01705 [Rubripirellula amarantea]|uniref:Uncharacterized protein n=1 Tax=Rubripirellula amarantea TaxID=2527999 RepID=A0A5C5WAP5_9BACT|nr:hypothetical protein [Rubripirellula amarantea]MDA8743323.1 hypothetical protein [Rubripirellula amarantea]TWT47928.1 hypothetical protein Pla22_52040 [Rubripirellula amarantea]